MRKIHLVTCLLLLSLCVGACKKSPTAPTEPVVEPTPTEGVAPVVQPTATDAAAPEPPTPTPVGARPAITCTQWFTAEQNWIATSPEAIPALGVTAPTAFFPIETWDSAGTRFSEYNPDADQFTLSRFMLTVTGTIRLALARPVANVNQPPGPEEDVSARWVVLVPDNQNLPMATWQEGAAVEPLGNQARSVIVERPISEIIPFTNDETSFEASRQALSAKVFERGNAATGGGLWVELLLVEQSDGQGGKQWNAYTFYSPEGAPSGDTRRNTYCCWWLGCQYNWRPICSVRCRLVSCWR